jgi:hypothetical protein
VAVESGLAVMGNPSSEAEIIATGKAAVNDESSWNPDVWGTERCEGPPR